MRRHLNTLYVTTQGAWLNKDGENVVVSVENQERGRVPLHTIGGIVGFGRVLVSPPLLGACMSAGISVQYLTEEGRFLARVEGPVSGNVHLRRTQYRWADEASRQVSIVKSIVAGKILNQRAVLARGLRDHGDSTPDAIRTQLTAAVERLGGIARRLEKSLDVDQWTAHVTLARRVGGAQLGRALRIAGRPAEIHGSIVGLRRWDGNKRTEHPIN